MKILNMSQVNVFVPDDQKYRVLAYGELLRAQEFLNVVLSQDATSLQRRVVADRNFVAEPEKNRVDYLDHISRANKFGLEKRIQQVRDHTEKARAAKSALGLADSDDDVYKFASLAVAHSSMAAALYECIAIEMDDLAASKFRKEEAATPPLGDTEEPEDENEN